MVISNCVPQSFTINRHSVISETHKQHNCAYFVKYVPLFQLQFHTVKISQSCTEMPILAFLSLLCETKKNPVAKCYPSGNRIQASHSL